MSKNYLESLVSDCYGIKNSEQYQNFITQLAERVDEPLPLDCVDLNFSDNDQEKMKLACVFMSNAIHDHGRIFEEKEIRKVFEGLAHCQFGPGSSSSKLAAAIAVYLIHHSDNYHNFFREFFLSSDTFTPPAAPKEAVFFMFFLMGCTEDANFVPLLYEALTLNHHFFNQSFAADALNNLGAEQDEEEIAYNRSITVKVFDSKITITTDKRYTGSSECPNCDYFPCKINQYYTGGIQDCKLWNKTDPASLGEMIDKRDWGDEGHLVSDVIDIDSEIDIIWKQALSKLKGKAYLEAIPLLCSSLSLINLSAIHTKSSLVPRAWLYLSHCFNVHQEEKLAFIALREAVKFKQLVPEKQVRERKLIASFNPEKYAHLSNNPSSFMAASNFKHHGRWVKAFDRHVDENIRKGGKTGGEWFLMGECCRELEEYFLAEFFMKIGAEVARSISSTDNLAEKFTASAEEVRCILDSGIESERLAVQRRYDQRHSASRGSVNGFCLDTYKFIDITNAAKQATSECQGIRDYFEVSRSAYDDGKQQLAIEVVQAAVNFCESDASKVYPLSLAARFFAETSDYEKALCYLDWALELKPKDERLELMKMNVIKLNESFL